MLRVDLQAHVTASWVGLDGTAFAAGKGILYRVGPEGCWRLGLADDMVERAACRFVYQARDGRLLYGCGEGRVGILDEKGLRLGTIGISGAAHGLVEAPDGTYFVANYGRRGPACVLRSRDSLQWKVCGVWDARHVHDLRINPHNGWLYVVVGEADGGKTVDSHAVYRSCDGGRSFVRVLDGARPLYFSINFQRDNVLLGTDHTEPGLANHIACFRDTGETRLYSCETLCAFEDPSFRLVGFLEWVDGVLLAGVSGFDASMLLASTDLTKWQVLSTMPGFGYIRASRSWGTKSLAVVHADAPGKSFVVGDLSGWEGCYGVGA